MSVAQLPLCVSKRQQYLLELFVRNTRTKDKVAKRDIGLLHYLAGEQYGQEQITKKGIRLYLVIQ